MFEDPGEDLQPGVSRAKDRRRLSLSFSRESVAKEGDLLLGRLQRFDLLPLA